MYCEPVPVLVRVAVGLSLTLCLYLGANASAARQARLDVGVYASDVHFYSNDWDGREDLKRIDTKVCKVSLLTGEFDYSCTPEMTRAAASAIPGCRLVIMDGIGHFPMIENYPLFRKYLLPELDWMAQ